jgi:GDP-L-fucose synthase
LTSRDEIGPLVNIGSGEDMTVRELAELVAEVVGIAPLLVFDSSRPDGTPRKLLDTGRLAGLGWKPQIGLREGLRKTYADFCSRLKAGEPADQGAAISLTQCAF